MFVILKDCREVMRTADLKYHVSRLNIFCARRRLSLTWKRSKMIMSLLRYKKATITPNKKKSFRGEIHGAMYNLQGVYSSTVKSTCFQAAPSLATPSCLILPAWC